MPTFAPTGAPTAAPTKSFDFDLGFTYCSESYDVTLGSGTTVQDCQRRCSFAAGCRSFVLYQAYNLCLGSTGSCCTGATYAGFQAGRLSDTVCTDPPTSSPTLPPTPSPTVGATCTAGTVVTVDTEDNTATLTGTWDPRTNPGTGGAFLGAHYLSNQDDPSSTINFPVPLTEGGVYRVEVIYTVTTTRATNAAFTVNHAGGASLVNVNQQVNAAGDGWVSLGSFTFAAGSASVFLDAASADGKVIGDAVRFVCETAPST